MAVKKRLRIFTPTSENGLYNLTYIFNWIETTHPYTPQKFNMDTKNGHISKESSFPNHNFLGGSFKYFVFSLYLGKIPILTNIFQRGWNHQPVLDIHVSFRGIYLFKANPLLLQQHWGSSSRPLVAQFGSCVPWCIPRFVSLLVFWSKLNGSCEFVWLKKAAFFGAYNFMKTLGVA